MRDELVVDTYVTRVRLILHRWTPLEVWKSPDDGFYTCHRQRRGQNEQDGAKRTVGLDPLDFLILCVCVRDKGTEYG